MPASFQIYRSGEGRRHEARGSKMFFKAVADTTGGRFSLMERTLPPGGRTPPAHVHLGNDEGFFVLAGTITFLLDGAERPEGPGTFLLVPGGTAHTFGNRTGQPARLLILHAPALDAHFAELEQLWSGTTEPSEGERALMARYGMQRA